MSLKQANRYPDAIEWEIAHNEELDKLDKNGTIKWIPDSDVPPNTQTIPLTMGYRYKRTADGTIIERKARCAMRGDLMKPNLHYNPDIPQH